MKVKHVIMGAVALLIVLVGLFIYLLRDQRSTLEAEKEAFASAQTEAMKEELAILQDEYQNQYNKLTINGRETTMTLRNDSLIHQLNGERAKVSRLIEELNRTKKTSAARIAELTKEIGSLRRVLKTYVIQIDSLHATNERLRAENKEVKMSFDRATTEVRQLASEKSELTSRVNLAAKLDATAISVIPLDKRGKSTRRIDKVENLQISFRVAKNVTASVGNKTFYTRIMRPDDEVMIKAGAGSFTFEGKQLQYSTRREIEYNGEETAVTMYWPVEETLQSGTYRIMIFADGNLIGSTSFSL